MRACLFCLAMCFVICLGCKREKPPLFDNATIQQLADTDTEGAIPPPPMPDFYAKSENGSICITNLQSLRFQYRAGYTTKYPSFESFLTDVLNLKKELRRVAIYSGKENCFIPDAEIAEKYSNLSFKQFFNEYCTKENGRYTFKSHVKANYNHILTVSYFLYLKSYQVGFDDYSGFYSISSRSIFPE